MTSSMQLFYEYFFSLPQNWQTLIKLRIPPLCKCKVIYALPPVTFHITRSAVVISEKTSTDTTAIFCSQLFWERSLSSSVCKKQLFPMFTSNSIDSSSAYLTLPLGTLYRTIFDIDLYM